MTLIFYAYYTYIVKSGLFGENGLEFLQVIRASIYLGIFYFVVQREF